MEARDRANAMGSSLYSSPNMHEHQDLSRRDDLYSLMYSILDLFGLPIPWRGIPSMSEVANLKKSNSLSSLFEPLGEKFVNIAKHIESLGYADAPNYKLIQENLVGGEETPTEFEWMSQRPTESIHPHHDNNWDPTGFLLSMCPYLINSESKDSCLLI